MEIPRMLPARGMRQGGGAGSHEGGGRIREGPDLRASQAPARRLLLLRGPQDGGPGRRREEASAASSCPGPGPSPLALRPDHASGCGSGGGSSGGDDFFLVLLDPEEETQFGFSSPAGNHGSQKETDLITVTGSSFLSTAALTLGLLHSP